MPIFPANLATSCCRKFSQALLSGLYLKSMLISDHRRQVSRCSYKRRLKYDEKFFHKMIQSVTLIFFPRYVQLKNIFCTANDVTCLVMFSCRIAALKVMPFEYLLQKDICGYYNFILTLFHVECGQTFFEPKHVFSLSTNADESQIDFEYCQWTIRAARGEKIKLYITSLYSHYTPNCTVDYLEIRNGYQTNSTVLGAFLIIFYESNIDNCYI